jgi:hypothetical protein
VRSLSLSLAPVGLRTPRWGEAGRSVTQPQMGHYTRLFTESVEGAEYILIHHTHTLLKSVRDFNQRAGRVKSGVQDFQLYSICRGEVIVYN